MLTFIHDATVATAVAIGPLFVLMLGLGLLIGVLQAATQINDAAVGFLPKVFVGGLACLLIGPWMLERFVLI
ncbi:MAG: flagellar biosynthetic protein FliQ, partial [bacterium]